MPIPSTLMSKIFTPSSLIGLSLTVLSHAAVTSVDDFTPAWTAISYMNPANADPFADSNGQQAEELVGSATTPFLFTGYDSANDHAYFRTRHAETKVTGKSSVFSSNLIIGIDADSDFKIDAFVGVSTQGGGFDVFLAAPDTTNADNNKSFNSITIDSGSYQKFTATTDNYRWDAVTTDDDPNDIDIDGSYTAGPPAANEDDIDYYLSFRVSFSALATIIENSSTTLNNGDVGADTPFRFFVATSTNDSNFNKDIGGLNGRDNTLLNTAFSELPQVHTDLVTASGAPVIVPEPSSSALLLGSLLGALGIRRRK